MSSAVAVGRKTAGKPAVRSSAEFRELLEQVLTEVDADERTGALLRAAGLAVRFEFTDLGLILNVAVSDDPHRHLRWAFSDRAGWSPKLDLKMDSKTANSYLQGRESLAVAIARGRVQCRGEARVALLYLPAMRLLCEPYRGVVTDEFPHLAIA